MSRERRSFTDEYKAEVVKLVTEQERPVRQVCQELDLSESAVRGWVRRAEIDAGGGAEGALTRAEREELRRLRRELKVALNCPFLFSRGAADYRVALMCAEKEPLHCHRTLLIGYELDECGVDVAHILPDGRLEPHASAMTRLLAEFGLETGDDLFRQHKPRGELITEAITRQAERVGHLIEVSR